ncbi:poly-gamma-glutamate hydrolase family protein [Kribbella sp. NPDC050281]|uniref:poly-gamma-glutamate hydrolase family protein n=1 Tax=Kribbella sp. NPDC050281 TaxID=3155515 RepID=UPI0033D79F38
MGGGAVDDAAERYGTNSELYADTSLTEGVDYGRRYRRHEWFDDDLAGRVEVQRTTILAPHGGGIEAGTSELCLGIAGYHPADLEPTPTDGPVHDYWMFEGLRSTGNAELHVTSTGCDDHVALSMTGGSLNAVGLHGCTTAQAELPDDTKAVLVGGRSAAFKSALLERLIESGILAIDAAAVPALNGDEPTNIANRTLLGAGAQLELTTPLRRAMFRINTREDRKNTTRRPFWTFTTAVRTAIADLESIQPIP